LANGNGAELATIAAAALGGTGRLSSMIFGTIISVLQPSTP
jgi:ABC-type xylose transport system permease subunit